MRIELDNLTVTSLEAADGRASAWLYIQSDLGPMKVDIQIYHQGIAPPLHSLVNLVIDIDEPEQP